MMTVRPIFGGIRMRLSIRFAFLGAFVLVVAGCGKPADNPMPVTKGPDPGVEKSLAKLTPEARKLAEAQKDCPVSGHALGSMDAPVEMKVEGETVFICCEHCRKSALKDPQKTLAKVKELKGEK
jgi:hypothetical protein